MSRDGMNYFLAVSLLLTLAIFPREFCPRFSLVNPCRVSCIFHYSVQQSHVKKDTYQKYNRGIKLKISTKLRNRQWCIGLNYSLTRSCTRSVAILEKDLERKIEFYSFSVKALCCQLKNIEGGRYNEKGHVYIYSSFCTSSHPIVKG